MQHWNFIVGNCIAITIRFTQHLIWQNFVYIGYWYMYIDIGLQLALNGRKQTQS